MKNKLIRKTSLFLVGVLAILSVVFLIRIPKDNLGNIENIHFEYYEDSTGNMGLEEVQKQFILGKSNIHKKNSFSFGKTSSTYWIRIPLDQIDKHTYKEYISIYNPTATKTILYLPLHKKDRFHYKKFSSGWYFGEEKQDEGFFYPVFRWDENTDFKRDAYVRVYSHFTQNYRIMFLSHCEFEQIKRNNFIFHGILFGILFAVAIQNLLIFIELKDKANLYFGFYMIFMVLYQGNLLGIYNVFALRYCNLIMRNTVTFSLMAMSGVLLFFRQFFRTKEFFYRYDKILKGLFICVCAGLIFIIGNRPVLANLYAHSISNIGAIFMMFVAFKACNKGFEQARLFMLGWIFVIISLVISFLRHSGWIPNNVITINITFIAVVIQSLLLSTALVKMVKILTKEKEKVLIQYKEAEENARFHEIAFLQAQIKPHFLYNALNVIISLCRIDPQKARELLLDLSGVLRHTFDLHKERKWVFLEDELEYIKAYVRIEQARFRNKLNVIYEIDESIELKIPPLILQPLVENAIVHGIRKKNGVGQIILRVESEGSDFNIEVEDDGFGMTKEQIDKVLSDDFYKGKGVGLTNINKRIKKLYGKGITIESSPNQGTRISMIIRNKIIHKDKRYMDLAEGGMNHADSYIDR